MHYKRYVTVARRGECPERRDNRVLAQVTVAVALLGQPQHELHVVHHHVRDVVHVPGVFHRLRAISEPVAIYLEAYIDRAMHIQMYTGRK